MAEINLEKAARRAGVSPAVMSQFIDILKSEADYLSDYDQFSLLDGARGPGPVTSSGVLREVIDDEYSGGPSKAEIEAAGQASKARIVQFAQDNNLNLSYDGKPFAMGDRNLNLLMYGHDVGERTGGGIRAMGDRFGYVTPADMSGSEIFAEVVIPLVAGAIVSGGIGSAATTAGASAKTAGVLSNVIGSVAAGGDVEDVLLGAVVGGGVGSLASRAGANAQTAAALGSGAGNYAQTGDLSSALVGAASGYFNTNPNGTTGPSTSQTPNPDVIMNLSGEVARNSSGVDNFLNSLPGLQEIGNRYNQARAWENGESVDYLEEIMRQNPGLLDEDPTVIYDRQAGGGLPDPVTQPVEQDSSESGGGGGGGSSATTPEPLPQAQISEIGNQNPEAFFVVIDGVTYNAWDGSVATDDRLGERPDDGLYNDGGQRLPDPGEESEMQIADASDNWLSTGGTRNGTERVTDSSNPSNSNGASDRGSDSDSGGSGQGVGQGEGTGSGTGTGAGQGSGNGGGSGAGEGDGSGDGNGGDGSGLGSGLAQGLASIRTTVTPNDPQVPGEITPYDWVNRFANAKQETQFGIQSERVTASTKDDMINEFVADGYDPREAAELAETAIELREDNTL